MPASAAKRWSADEARRLNEENPHGWPRYEVVDGELLVSPAPRTAHQRAVGELLYLLRRSLDGSRDLEVLPGPADISLELDSTLSPDLFVCPITAGRRFHRWPEIRRLALVCEVLSPSTARYDRVTKRDYFMRNDVEEYWVVDLDARIVERWRHGEARPEMISGELRWHPEGLTETLVVDLEAFFESVCDQTEAE